LLLAPLFATAVLLVAPDGAALANGDPVTIVLAYLNGVSNWGPTNAAGVAELVLKEGEVRLTATNLPALSGEDYRLWVLNTASGDYKQIAAFNSGPDQVARVDTFLAEPETRDGWDLVLVSIETADSTPAKAGARHSIAGRYPVHGTEQGRPALLPNTGGNPDEPATDASALWVGAAGLLVGSATTTLFWVRSAKRGAR
jgi:hypothetical protein